MYSLMQNMAGWHGPGPSITFLCKYLISHMLVKNIFPGIPLHILLSDSVSLQDIMGLSESIVKVDLGQRKEYDISLS